MDIGEIEESRAGTGSRIECGMTERGLDPGSEFGMTEGGLDPGSEPGMTEGGLDPGSESGMTNHCHPRTINCPPGLDPGSSLYPFV